MSGHHPTYTMAALLAAGGIMGYMKKKSIPSLVAGVSLGVGFAGAGCLIQRGNMQWGHGLALALSGITTLAMGSRGLKTNGKVPLVVSSLSAVSAAYHALRLSQWMGQE